MERGRLIEEDASSVGSEKVLIEKDGVFELVSTSEVHAGESASKIDAGDKQTTTTDDASSHHEAAQPDMNTPADHAESTTRDHGPGKSTKENETNRTVQQQATPEAAVLSDKQPKENESRTGVDSSVPTTDQSAVGDNDVTYSRLIRQDVTSSSTPPNTTVAAPSPPIQKASQQSNQAKSLSSKSVVVSSNRQKKSNTKSNANVPRTTSAPASRSPEKKLTTAEEQEKLRLNEQAFQSWLSKKNKDITERLKQERLKEKKSEEEIGRKKEENEQAYKAWLAMKHSQLIALSRRKETNFPVIDEEEEEKKRIDESFETWLSQKRVQRKQEEEVGRKKTEEVEQVARKIDPEIASAAYKQLVNHSHIGRHCQ